MIGRTRSWRQPEWDSLRLGVLQGTILAATLTWSLHFVTYLDVKEATLWVGVVLFWITNTIAGRDSMSGFRALAPCWVTLLVVAILGWSVAPVPAFVAREGLRLLPLLLLATFAYDLLQEPQYHARILRTIVCAACCAAGLALLQAWGALPGLFPAFAHYDQKMYSVFGNAGLLAGYLAIALVIFPGIVSESASGRIRVFFIAGAGIFIATLLLSDSRGGLAAMLAGLCALLLLRALSLRAVAAGLAGAALLGAVLYIALGLTPWEKWLELFSADDTGGNLRRWIVRASVHLVSEHPLLGCGLGNYAYAIPVWLGASAPEGGIGVNTLTTYHAHLDLLEWICETGIIGLVGAGWIASRVRARSAPAFGGLVAVIVFSFTHPAFHSAPHALVALLLYAMNVKPSSAASALAQSRHRVRLIAPLCFLLVAGGSVAFVATELYPSFLLRRAEDRHLAGEEVTEDYARAIGAWGFHPEAHESYGIYAYEHGDFTLALEQFHHARQGLDTGRIHHLLAMTSARLNDRAAACRWYGSCAERWPWVSAVQSRRREYCGTEHKSGDGHRQEAVNQKQVSR